MTNCCRGLSCQVLPLRASRKDGALLKGERNSHENVQVAANWKPALQLTSLISVGEHVCAQSFFITTHTNKLTVSSLLCWLNWAQREKKKKKFTFQEAAELQRQGWKTCGWKACMDAAHIYIQQSEQQWDGKGQAFPKMFIFKERAFARVFINGLNEVEKCWSAHV